MSRLPPFVRAIALIGCGFGLANFVSCDKLANVNASHLFVRYMASPKAPFVTSIKKDTLVNILEEDGNWVLIELREPVGWVNRKYLDE